MSKRAKASDDIPADALRINLDTIGKTYKTELEQKGLLVKSGDSIFFQVRGNPTTGYEWHVDEEVTNGAFTVKKKY